MVAAIGRPQMITADFVKPGAIVIDVGINKITDNNGKSRLVGDVDFDSVQPIAQYITPVPGGYWPDDRGDVITKYLLELFGKISVEALLTVNG